MLSLAFIMLVSSCSKSEEGYIYRLKMEEFLKLEVVPGSEPLTEATKIAARQFIFKEASQVLTKTQNKSEAEIIAAMDEFAKKQCEQDDVRGTFGLYRRESLLGTETKVKEYTIAPIK